MTHWPLLLPPPAVSTLPLRLRRSSLFIVVKSPSHHSLPPSCCRHAVHRRSAAPSITIHLPSRCPSPPIAVVLSVHCRAVEEPSRAVPHRRGAVTPSLTVEEPLRRPLPSRSRHAVHCRRGAVMPYLTIKEPLAVSADDSGHSSHPSKPLVVWLVAVLPLLTPLPPICRRLSFWPSSFVPLVCPASCPVSSLLTPPPPICQRLRLSSRRRLLLSRPSRASCPAGSGVASPHAAATYLRDNRKQSAEWFIVSLMD